MTQLEDALRMARQEDIDALYVGIADNDPELLGYQERSLRQKLADGKEWWQQRERDLHDIVCPALKETKLTNALASDAAALVLGLIGEKYGAGIAGYVTALVLHHVVQGWCQAPSK